MDMNKDSKMLAEAYDQVEDLRGWAKAGMDSASFISFLVYSNGSSAMPSFNNIQDELCNSSLEFVSSL